MCSSLIRTSGLQFDLLLSLWDEYVVHSQATDTCGERIAGFQVAMYAEGPL